jgi:ABC-type transporter Mla subunit MlaD
LGRSSWSIAQLYGAKYAEYALTAAALEPTFGQLNPTFDQLNSTFSQLNPTFDQLSRLSMKTHPNFDANFDR